MGHPEVGVLLSLLVVVVTATKRLPHWTAPKPDTHKPLAGWTSYSSVQHVPVYWGSEPGGWYNHAAMIHYHEGLFVLSWKNAPYSEDTPGQRVLYAHSTDGLEWSTAQILFPNVSTDTTPAAMFAGPFAVLNGRLYATATPAVIAAGDAQGAQWCLWPDGLDPRNCATPDRPGDQPSGILLMRRVFPGGKELGPIFWVSKHPASVFAGHNISQLEDMDPLTQQDVALLTPTMESLPCDLNGTTKCEGCRGGCQFYDHIQKGLGIANERTHWTVDDGSDVIAYRSHSDALYASIRAAGGKQSDWSPIELTDIPNDNSNINAGQLPDGRVYLVSNAAPNKIRDPLTVAVSSDGFNFNKVKVVQTCTHLLHNSTCKARQQANRNSGPSYPQALVVTAPADESVRGFYVVATNNKEDVILTKVALSEV